MAFSQRIYRTIFIFLAVLSLAFRGDGFQENNHGAIVRGDVNQPSIALVFTGDEFADGGKSIRKTLKANAIHASFFLTGRFYRNAQFKTIIETLIKDGHYLGAHSDQHLLYCDWRKRDSLLVSKKEFKDDLLANYRAMNTFGIRSNDAPYFLPPYEWYNDSIAQWTKELGFQLINYTPGTLSHADYTTPDMVHYRSSEKILQSIVDYESKGTHGLNGFILLMHIGTDPRRTDKLYAHIDGIIKQLTGKGYRFVRINELLAQ